MTCSSCPSTPVAVGESWSDCSPTPRPPCCWACCSRIRIAAGVLDLLEGVSVACGNRPPSHRRRERRVGRGAAPSTIEDRLRDRRPTAQRRLDAFRTFPNELPRIRPRRSASRSIVGALAMPICSLASATRRSRPRCPAAAPRAGLRPTGMSVAGVQRSGGRRKVAGGWRSTSRSHARVRPLHRDVVACPRGVELRLSLGRRLRAARLERFVVSCKRSPRRPSRSVQDCL